MNLYDDLQSLDSKKSYEEVKSFFLNATEVKGLLKERMDKFIGYWNTCYDFKGYTVTS